VPKSQDLTAFTDPDRPKTLTVRFAIALLLVVLGIAWMAYYYLAVREDPLSGETGKLLGVPGDWNYLVGFGALLLGLAVSAHPSTPLGRGRGVVIGMLGCFVVGLIWICTFYLFANSSDTGGIPIMNDLGQKNLFVGIGFMAIGFTFATRWE
jgi:hypothetical protein